jgi:hypothetical protein
MNLSTSPGSSESRLRRKLRSVAFLMALTGLVAVPALYVSGGVEVWLFGVEIRAHRPLRALWLFAFGSVAFVALGGRLTAEIQAIPKKSNSGNSRNRRMLKMVRIDSP